MTSTMNDAATNAVTAPATDTKFLSAYNQDLARVVTVTPPVMLVDPAASATAIIKQVRTLAEDGVYLAAFPELCLTGYAIDDLLLSDIPLPDVLAAIETLRAAGADLLIVFAAGAPLCLDGRLYNYTLIIQGGRVRGVAPKLCLPTYRRFRGKRHFAPGDAPPAGVESIELPGAHGGSDGAERTKSTDGFGCPETTVRVPLEANLLFEAEDVPGLTSHVEICGDIWMPVSPSSVAALAEAAVPVNPSGSPIIVGRAGDHELLARSSSVRGLAAYVYATAGQGKSPTDLTWDGQTLVYKDDKLLGTTGRFSDGPYATVVDVDIKGLHAGRPRQGIFADSTRTLGSPVAGTPASAVAFTDPAAFRRIRIGAVDLAISHTDIDLRRRVDRFPFVSGDPARLTQDCCEACNIQVAALVRRLGATGNPRIVIGVSGGLDSTHTPIAAARVVDCLGCPRSDIHAITMPGFATNADTRRNAEDLAVGLDCTLEGPDIRATAIQMPTGMNHPYDEYTHTGILPEGVSGRDLYDITFENVQVGLRTDFLFRIASHRGDIALGIGDLSELILGWYIFGVGDQMAHYGVSAGIPKTLIQHLVHWVTAEELFDGAVGHTLLSILDTEISPGLVPTEAGGAIQLTQTKIGLYTPQDFTLQYVLRHGSRPSRTTFLAHKAWTDVQSEDRSEGLPSSGRAAYDLSEVRRWFKLFRRRLFTNQFKCSTLPNGPKVVAGDSLSPRDGRRMPSDAAATT